MGFLPFLALLAVLLFALQPFCSGRLVRPQEPLPKTSATYYTIAGHTYTIPGLTRAGQLLHLVERNTWIFSDIHGDFFVTNAVYGELITVESDINPLGVDFMRSITWQVTGSVLDPRQGIILQYVPTVTWPIITTASTLAAKKPWNRLNSCYFLVTVTLKGKYYNDPLPQGPAGAVLKISGFTGPMFYADVWLGNITSVFTFKTRTTTSVDGGVFIPNVPVSSGLYQISAVLGGYNFTSPFMSCKTPGYLVNAGPHNGPTIL